MMVAFKTTKNTRKERVVVGSSDVTCPPKIRFLVKSDMEAIPFST